MEEDESEKAGVSRGDMLYYPWLRDVLLILGSMFLRTWQKFV
jgi:hypothetical protein